MVVETERYARTSSSFFLQESPTPVVDAAIHYMRENIENRISIQGVIKYIGYSASRFATLFKQQPEIDDTSILP